MWVERNVLLKMRGHARIGKPTTPEMKRGCRGVSRRPDNLLTWSAAGELQPGGPCVPPHPVPCALIGGRYLPHMPSDISSASPERTEPNSLLNHETSDHLLSLVEKTRPSLTATAMCAGCSVDTSLVLQKISRNPQRLCGTLGKCPPLPATILGHAFDLRP